MKIVSISDEYYEKFAQGDREFMQKHGRPCLVVMRLAFRGKKRDFAVPFRSNISPSAPKGQYFALPPRPTTKPGHRHGIHYIKMFPIAKKYQVRFRTAGNSYYEMLEAFIESHAAEIIAGCQAYLADYEQNGKPRYAVDIDRILTLMTREEEDR